MASGLTRRRQHHIQHDRHALPRDDRLAQQIETIGRPCDRERQDAARESECDASEEGRDREDKEQLGETTVGETEERVGALEEEELGERTGEGVAHCGGRIKCGGWGRVGGSGLG